MIIFQLLWGKCRKIAGGFVCNDSRVYSTKSSTKSFIKNQENSDLPIIPEGYSGNYLNKFRTVGSRLWTRDEYFKKVPGTEHRIVDFNSPYVVHENNNQTNIDFKIGDSISISFVKAKGNETPQEILENFIKSSDLPPRTVAVVQRAFRDAKFVTMGTDNLSFVGDGHNTHVLLAIPASNRKLYEDAITMKNILDKNVGSTNIEPAQLSVLLHCNKKLPVPLSPMGKDLCLRSAKEIRRLEELGSFKQTAFYQERIAKAYGSHKGSGFISLENPLGEYNKGVGNYSTYRDTSIAPFYATNNTSLKTVVDESGYDLVATDSVSSRFVENAVSLTNYQTISSSVVGSQLHLPSFMEVVDGYLGVNGKDLVYVKRSFVRDTFVATKLNNFQSKLNQVQNTKHDSKIAGKEVHADVSHNNLAPVLNDKAGLDAVYDACDVLGLPRPIPVPGVGLVFKDDSRKTEGYLHTWSWPEEDLSTLASSLNLDKSLFENKSQSSSDPSDVI